MVETKIDHARLTTIMTGSSWRCDIQESPVGCTQLMCVSLSSSPEKRKNSTVNMSFLHQNYWPMEDFNQIAVAKNCVAPVRRNIFFCRRFILYGF